jgi:outer membrane protein
MNFFKQRLLRMKMLLNFSNATMPKLKYSVLTMGILSVCFFSVSVRAEGLVPLVNVGVAVDTYAPTATSGHINYTGSGYSSSTQMNSDPDRQVVLSAFLEHPIPVIPNVALRYTPVQLSSASAIVASSGSGFRTGTASTDLTLDQLDATLYYKMGLPIFDVLNVKVGATAKVFNGTISTTQVTGGSTTADKKSLTVPIPMAYLGVQVNIPRTQWALSADAHFVNYQNNAVHDITLKAEYRFKRLPGLKLHTGYRSVNVQIDDVSDVTADVKLNSAFVGLAYVF